MTEEIQVQREPWEMTQGEIIDQARKSKGWTSKASGFWRSKSFTGVVSEHRAVIKEALKEGKPIPTEVLESYPELLKPDVDVKPGDNVVVQGLKDTYEGVVVSVRDNSFTLRTPQWIKMQWDKSAITEITPGVDRDEYEAPPKESKRKGRKVGSSPTAGYLE